MLTVRKTAAALLDILFPPACLFCQAAVPRGRGLCEPCRNRIVIFDALQCGECGARLPSNTKICHHNVPYRLAAATQYDELITKSLIWQLKYKHRISAAPVLAQILCDHLALTRLDVSDYVLIPIPLHPRRQRGRGYNQSELLTRELGKLMRLPARCRM